MKKKVCIIGAGAGGLCAIKYILENQQNLEATVFERAGRIGGIWRYTHTKGTPECNEKFPTPVYKNLRMNTPKLCCQILDYPWRDSVDMFPYREDAINYLQSYADKFNLSGHIKFHQEVIEVKPIDPKNRENPGWAVKVKCLETDAINLYTFDYVMVCTGHEMEHSAPEIPAIEKFKGSVITAAEYHDPVIYSGKRVLLLGAGVSGHDIALDLLPRVKEVIISHKPRSKILEGLVTVLPEEIRVVPKWKAVTPDGAGFILDDNSVLNDIDAVIITTGYNYNYKFLAPECGITVENGRRVNYLYNHIVNVKFPTMFFIGVTFYAAGFYMDSVESKWVTKILDGTVALPNEDDMMANVAKIREEIKALGFDEFNYAHHIFIQEWKLFERLASEGQFDLIPYMEPVFSNFVVRLLTVPAKFRLDVYTKIDDTTVEICNAP